jgi:hypothetical protein
MALVSDIFQRAFEDLGVVTVNETITAAMSTDAFARINPLLDSLSAEGLVAFNQVTQIFNLQPTVTAYTLGAGGSFPTSGGLRPMKVTAWRAFFSTLLHSGGRVLSFPEFGEQAKQLMGETTPIPSIVAADTSFPLINVRVFPPTGPTPGQIELAFDTPIVNFATAGDTISMPQGWLDLLEWQMAKRLYPQYPSPSRKDLIWSMADETKANLMSQNAMTSPTNPQAAAPKGQQ